MLYSRLLAPWLLWLALMLTKTEPTAVRETTPVRQENNRTIKAECVGLCDSIAQRICGGGMDWTGVSLVNCGRPLANSIPSIPSDPTTCLAELRHLIRLDSEALVLARNFQSILSRFDCPQRYSVKFQCSQCQEAYLAWICSSILSYWQGDRTLKPCRSYCHRVEQKCPFFLPLDKGPAHYAGEPAFLCLDPNIGETEEQFEHSSYGSYDCCYEECDSENGGVCTRGSCVDALPEEDGTSKATCLPSDLITLALMLTSLILYRTRLVI